MTVERVKSKSLFFILIFGLLSVNHCFSKGDNRQKGPFDTTEDTSAVQWRAIEFTFTSDKSYQDSFNDIDLDVIFTHSNGTSLKVPAFWSTGNIWMVRFAPTLTGEWIYNTECTDESNTGLHNKTGNFTCAAYQGDLAIYKHGFVKTTPSRRYFTYNDSTPFFYLGDTHWNISVNALANFKTIIDKRVEQGFTVIQSGPYDADYDLSNGVTASDLLSFSKLDKRFKYVAEKGLVHANAQLFFVSELGWNRAKYSDAYLEKLCRYWVARYSAYPVMWTTAQECDNDFYYSEQQDYFDTETNPWKLVANYMHQYDPYEHPQTGHMENVGHTIASSSSFRDLPGHSWFGVQWSPKKNGQLNFNVPKDFWNNGQGKPSVLYEGHFDHLWTNQFGARMQGWTAYLNGMYGHGYGAIDIWLYNSTYDMEEPSVIYGITVTVEEKQTKWDVSLEFPSAYQMGHMHNFFKSIEWWNLIPRFDDTDWFVNDGSWYSLASIDNDLYVVYFYNVNSYEANRATGVLKNLDDKETYRAQWYNPRDGRYTLLSSSVLSSAGSWIIPEKPDTLDWVLLLTNDGEELSEKSQGRWRLEANALDESGSNHGTIMGDAAFSATETREGEYSLVLDGVDDHLMIPDHPNLSDLDSFCIAFWMRSNGIPADSMVILEKGEAFRVIMDSTGRLKYSISTENNPWDSPGTVIQTDEPLESGTWYHIAMGYDGSSAYIYANGKLAGASEGVLSGKVPANAQDLLVGASAAVGWKLFSGLVDDLLFFREMPGPDEIYGLYSHYVPTASIVAAKSLADFDDNGVEPVVLDGTSSVDVDGFIVSYEWRDAEQALGTGEILQTEFGLGRYMVYLTITDNNGITSTDSVGIEITGPSFSRWSLEENGKDSKGNNHGILYGSPVFIWDSVMEDSFALSFDGVDDHVSIYDNSSLEGMDRFSFSFWVKTDELPPSVSMIMGKEMAYRVLLSSSGTYSWVIATENNPWYSDGTSISGYSKLMEDEWNHMVAGYDGANTYLYLNGRLETKSQKRLTGRIINNTSQLTFAKGINSNVGYFKGALDDVRYFKYMLSDSSVNRLFNFYPIIDTTGSQPVDTIAAINGIKEQLDKVLVFPNPANKHVLLKNLLPATNISLYSPGGRLLHSAIAEVPDHTLDVSQYGQGFYILKFRHENTLVFRKLVISR